MNLIPNRKEDKTHTVKIANKKRRKCPDCANFIKDRQQVPVVCNREEECKYEKIKKFNAKRRIWKHRDSEDEEEEKFQEEERKEKELYEKEKAKKKAEILARKEKKRLRVRARRKLGKKIKKRMANKKREEERIQNQKRCEEEEKEQVPKKPKEIPEKYIEEDKSKPRIRSFMEIPRKSPTFKNRARHAIVIKTRSRRHHGLYLRKCHEHFHLYNTELERKKLLPEIEDIEKIMMVGSAGDRTKKYDPLNSKKDMKEFDQFLIYL